MQVPPHFSPEWIGAFLRGPNNVLTATLLKLMSDDPDVLVKEVAFCISGGALFEKE
jgi:hypothetical protein